MFKSEYVIRVYESVEKSSGTQKEFLQAVKEVLETIEPVVEANPAIEKNGVLERLVEPERQVFFRVRLMIRGRFA